MSEEHDAMKAALQSIVVPILRNKGFRGTFPHFRRIHEERIDLLTFQFDKHGGGFIVEISKCQSSGFTTHWGKHIPPNKVTAWDLHPDQRIRLKPTNGSGTDSWFRFEGGNFQSVAQAFLPFLHQAESWWQSDT